MIVEKPLDLSEPLVPEMLDEIIPPCPGYKGYRTVHEVRDGEGVAAILLLEWQ